ncbi:MAG: AraC family transcriptional regulator [Beijerinckiaceae bacterium]
MHRPVTTASYAERIDRVLVAIAADIDRRHSLQDLADIACFSPFHFHRIYHATTGETVEETIRRLRLHRAAADLNSTKLPMERISQRAGYGSLAAFSRAFKADYGLPPSAYRRGRCSDLSRVKLKTQEMTMYDITIGSHEAFRLAGLAHKGDYNAIGTTFDRVSAMAAAKGLFTADTRMFGVYFDDPDSVPLSALRSFAGVSVAANYQPDGDMKLQDIPGGVSASLLHKGPYAELHKAYSYLYKEWLPQSGREPADNPPFEEYLNNPRSLPPTEWLTRVSIPLME